MELASPPFDRRTHPAFPPSLLPLPSPLFIPLEAPRPGRRAGLIMNGEEAELLLLLLPPSSSPYPLAASVHGVRAASLGKDRQCPGWRARRTS